MNSIILSVCVADCDARAELINKIGKFDVNFLSHDILEKVVFRNNDNQLYVAKFLHKALDIHKSRLFVIGD
jgi:flavin reductase (DIM6/NTAB) family NADH-FMN oxidoreductase RutF